MTARDELELVSSPVMPLILSAGYVCNSSCIFQFELELGKKFQNCSLARNVPVSSFPNIGQCLLIFKMSSKGGGETSACASFVPYASASASRQPHNQYAACHPEGGGSADVS